MKEDIYIKDELEDIVDAMKSSGDIDSISESGGAYTITTNDGTGNLEDDFKVKIGDLYFRVSTVTDTTFKVTSSTDISSETTWEMFLYFGFGSRLEIANILTLKGREHEEKFDLIWLFTNYRETFPEDDETIDREVDITFAIVTNSEPSLKLTASQRYDQKFKTILYPLFKLLRSEIESSDKLIFEIGERLGVEKFDRFFYGSDESGRNVLNEPTDAIEFKTSIKFKNQYSNNC